MDFLRGSSSSLINDQSLVFKSLFYSCYFYSSVSFQCILDYLFPIYRLRVIVFKVLIDGSIRERISKLNFIDGANSWRLC